MNDRPGRPAWFDFAACNPRWADRPLDQWVEVFFPTRGADLDPAREICDECPAKEACADLAIVGHEDKGVWGGTSERQRRTTRKRLRDAGQLPKLCRRCGDRFTSDGTPRFCSDACRAAHEADQAAAVARRHAEWQAQHDRDDQLTA